MDLVHAWLYSQLQVLPELQKCHLHVLIAAEVADTAVDQQPLHSAQLDDSDLILLLYGTDDPPQNPPQVDFESCAAGPLCAQIAVDCSGPDFHPAWTPLWVRSEATCLLPNVENRPRILGSDLLDPMQFILICQSHFAMVLLQQSVLFIFANIDVFRDIVRAVHVFHLKKSLTNLLIIESLKRI